MPAPDDEDMVMVNRDDTDAYQKSGSREAERRSRKKVQNHRLDSLICVMFG